MSSLMKKSVNLILERIREPPFVKKLKVILPIVAVFSLVFFVAVFLLSLYYVDSNIYELNILKQEAETLEQQISQQKKVEGVYTLTVLRLDVLNQILAKRKDFSKVIMEIDSLQEDEISLISASIDEKDNVLLSLVASSSAALDRLVNLLLDRETKGFFSDIYARGIVREKESSYTLSISFKSKQ